MAIDYAAYDYTVLVDTSGSMLTSEGNKTRFEVAKEFTVGLSHYLAKYDSDGISVGYFGNDRVVINENTTAEKVAQLFDEQRPIGGTPTAKALAEAIKPSASGKPEVIFVITDGEPDNRAEVEKVLIAAADKLEKDEDLAIMFIQVGSDAGAAAFLQHLDDNLKAKFDIVDTKKMSEITSPEAAIEAALND